MEIPEQTGNIPTGVVTGATHVDADENRTLSTQDGDAAHEVRPDRGQRSPPGRRPSPRTTARSRDRRTDRALPRGHPRMTAPVRHRRALSPLARAIVADAATHGLDITIADERERAWASATFTGTRHRLRVTLGETDARAAWLAALPEAEFTVPARIVIDIAAAATDPHGAVLEALTVTAD